MKTITSISILLAAFAGAAQAELSCPLTAEDRAQLAASPAKIASDEAIAALPAEKRAKLCQSIKTVKELRNTGRKLTDSKEASLVYLGPAYKQIFSKALNDYLEQLLASKFRNK